MENKREQKQINNKTFEKRNFYTNDDSGKVFIFALLLPYILMFILSLVAGFIERGMNAEAGTITSHVGFLIPATLLTQLSFLGIFILYNKMFSITYKASTITNKPRWQDILIAILVACISLFGLLLFTNCYDVFLNNVLKFPVNEGLTGIPLDNFGWFTLNLLLLGILPGVCEELIFRGVVLQGIRKNFSDWVAIVVSALMFALFHTNLQQFIYPFILGLILGWIAIRSGSLTISIIVHTTNNFIVVLLAYINKPFADFQNVWWYYLLAFVLLAITGLIIYLIDKFYFKRKNHNDIEKEKVAKISPFIWLGIGVSVILLVLDTIMRYLG